MTPAILVLLREHLDDEVGEHAATVLFEALGAWGPRAPASFVDVVELVNGPLRDSLSRRFGPARAVEVVRRLEQALRLAELPTQELSPVPRRAFDEETTKLVPRPASPTMIAVGASGRLGERIAALVDPARGSVLVARSIEALARAPRPLELAMIDAFDPLPRTAPARVADALLDVPLVLLWGSEAPDAASLLAALEKSGVPVMGFARSEAVDPMIDVLRARFG